jgi:hypothetical protein
MSFKDKLDSMKNDLIRKKNVLQLECKYSNIRVCNLIFDDNKVESDYEVIILEDDNNNKQLNLIEDQLNTYYKHLQYYIDCTIYQSDHTLSYICKIDGLIEDIKRKHLTFGAIYHFDTASTFIDIVRTRISQLSNANKRVDYDTCISIEGNDIEQIDMDPFPLIRREDGYFA